MNIEILSIQVICWRDVPTDNSHIGQVAKKCEPYMRQVFVTGDQEVDVLNRQVRWRTLLSVLGHTEKKFEKGKM